MKKKITFVQALATAVGCVIGSGIFFRADNILKATQGNPATAVAGWIILGLTLIFAGLSTAVLAKRSTRPGGVVGYLEEFLSNKVSFAAGWFLVSIYVPALCAVLALVATNYAIGLFGWNVTLGQKYLIIAATVVAVYAWNIISTKFGALFSTWATFIKLLPLVAIALAGIVFGQGNSDLLVAGLGNMGSAVAEKAGDNYVQLSSAKHVGLALFTAPLLSMAFAFDGWFSVGTLGRDMENPEKNLAKVFAWNAVLVTVVYASYFAATTLLMDPIEIMNIGDLHVGLIANRLFGAMGEKLVLTAVVISVLGTLNGNSMAGMRYVQALSEDGNFPYSKVFKVIDPKTHTAARGGILSTITSLILVGMFYTQDLTANTTKYFQGISFDDIPIMFMAMFIILLMYASHNVAKKENLGPFLTYVTPIVAAIGQGFVIVSFFNTNEMALRYLIISLIIVGLGFVARKIGNGSCECSTAKN